MEEQSMNMTRAANLCLSFERFERMVAANALMGTGQKNSFGIAASQNQGKSGSFANSLNAKAHTNANAIYWRALSALDDPQEYVEMRTKMF